MRSGSEDASVAVGQGFQYLQFGRDLIDDVMIIAFLSYI
jgi:hypothetical protein